MTEAPRLWYLKAKNLLEGIGAVELNIARAVFVFREKNKTGTAGLIDILSLYVVMDYFSEIQRIRGFNESR